MPISLTTFKKITAVLMLCFVSQVQAQDGLSFIHQANAGNTNFNTTTIDNPLANFQKDVAVFITVASRHTRTADGAVIPLSPAVMYEEGRWKIINQKGAPIIPGTKFNILVMPTSHPDVFFHRNRNRAQILIESNSGHTVFRNRRTDGDPDASLIVTPVLKTANLTCPWVEPALVTKYRNNAWTIDTANNTKIPKNACFFLLVSPDTTVVKTRPGTVGADIIDTRTTTENPAEIFITGRGNASTSAPGLFVERVGNNWRANKQPVKSWVRGEKLNVLSSKALSDEYSYRLYTYDGLAWSVSRYMGEPLAFYDPASNEEIELIGIESVGYANNGKLVFERGELNSRSIIDAGFIDTVDGTQVLSKYIVNNHQQKIGVFSVLDDRSAIVRFDYDLDGAVDYLEYHDGSGQSFFIVREHVKALESWRYINELRNPLCSMAPITDDQGQQAVGYAPTINRRASFIGCNRNGRVQDSGSMVGGARSPSPSTQQSNFTEQMCYGVLSTSDTRRINSLVAGWREDQRFGIGLIVTGSIALSATPVGWVAIAVGAYYFGSGEQDRPDAERAAAMRDQARAILESAIRHEREAERARASGDNERAEELEAEAREERRDAEKLEINADRVYPDTSEPIPGEGIDSASAVKEWCTDYLTDLKKWRELYATRAIDKKNSEISCHNPAERRASRTFADTAPGTGVAEVKVFCPWQNEITSSDDLYQALSDQCYSRVTEPNPNNRQACRSRGAGGSGTRASLDTKLPTPVDELIKTIKDQTVNPGRR